MAGILEPRVLHMGSACLVCLAEDPPDSCSIYERDQEPPHLRIVDKIKSCTDLQPSENGSAWPGRICSQCHMELTVTYRFREKCAAVEKVLRQEEQQERLKLDLEQHQVRLPASLKIKRLDLDPGPSSSCFSACDLVEGPDDFYQDEELTLLPDASDGLVMTLSGCPHPEPPKSEVEEEPMLALDPWGDDQTPEHFYEIETPLDSMVDSPTLPPPPLMPPMPRKRSYRRVAPLIQDDTDTYTAPGGSAKKKGKRQPAERLPKICDVCGNTYKYQHTLNAHMRRHNNDRPFGCEVCQKAFISNVELRRHMRVHTGQKPYTCQHCDRRFSDFGSSRKHERIHTGERPYVCEVCNKGFAYAHVLSIHRHTHTGKKQFQCTQCEKGFTKKSYLTTHMAQHGQSAPVAATSTSTSTSTSATATASAAAGSRLLISSGTAAGVGQLHLQNHPQVFPIDAVVLGEQNKVLEECIVANDFMFHDEVDEVEEDKPEVVADADFEDVEGYQSVRSVKELVGDLLDGEEFVDDTKYLID
ncbi:hypothetical protein KR018_010703 [Drosophila ironensis]|nr:hypothetical protein KR018_010703 [Drosophila ironensis]